MLSTLIRRQYSAPIKVSFIAVNDRQPTSPLIHNRGKFSSRIYGRKNAAGQLDQI